MSYVSTRGDAPARCLHELLTRGTAEDGGLYVPQTWPRFSAEECASMAELPYDRLVERLLALFAGPGWVERDFGSGIARTLRQFDCPGGPPLIRLDERLWSLELFHGPTFAFKDYALAPLAEMIDRELGSMQARATVLCATSGDTGAATANAFAGRKRTNAVILFPEGRVSDVQRRQMTSLAAPNVLALSVKGDFDDCQRIVKSLYRTKAATAYGYTAVNSINLVRILLQTAYYVHASLGIKKECGGPVNFVVPTGNFGNIFAGYIAKQLGAPVGQLIATSNENDVLPRLFETGRMAKAATVPTISPSMDIQVSSNFERMLWLLKGRDSSTTRALQAGLDESGNYELSPAEIGKLRLDFGAIRCSKEEALETMRRMKQRFNKTVCPHSATGFFAADALRNELTGPVVVTETAHPTKFPAAVCEALGHLPELPCRLQALLSNEEEFVTVNATTDAVQSAIDRAF